MKIHKHGTVAFGRYALVFSGWEVEGGTNYEFMVEAINICAPNLFIRAAMMAAI